MNPKIPQFLSTMTGLGAIIISCSGCGDDPVEPVQPPRITQFTAQPSNIMPGDSSLISYAVTGADSVKLFPDNVRLSPATSGDRYVHPPAPTDYGLVGYNEGGKDSASLTITMTGAAPSIQLLDLEPDTILIGDSIVLGWQTVRADSIVIDQGLGRMAVADSGGVTVHPTTSTTYRAVAFNQIGTDTASVSARVEVPFAVSAINGRHYRGVMGGGIAQPGFNFLILDQAGRVLYKPWLHFSVIEGDGSLLSDSVQPNVGAVILNDYQFSGQLGYSLIRAMVPDVDTLDVKVRASVLRLGAGGQGQYVRFDDLYSDVLALNDAPEAIDEDTSQWLNYAVYENSLGVVVAVTDVNQNHAMDDSEPVHEVILNTVFSPTTPEGIGISSHIDSVRSQFGDPDIFFYSPADPQNPEAWGMQYNSLGALFYAGTIPPDSAIIEIHIWEPVAGSAVSGSKMGRLEDSGIPSPRTARRPRRYR